MVIYEVEARVEESLCEGYERYMTSQHIPEVLATKRFVGASFETCVPGHYRVRYEATDQTELDKYLSENAHALRTDFLMHFPTGVEVRRDVWALIKQFA